PSIALVELQYGAGLVGDDPEAALLVVERQPIAAAVLIGAAFAERADPAAAHQFAERVERQAEATGNQRGIDLDRRRARWRHGRLDAQPTTMKSMTIAPGSCWR